MTATTQNTFEQNAISALNNHFEVSDFKSEGSFFQSMDLGGSEFYLVDEKAYADHCREIASSNDNPEPSEDEIETSWTEESNIINLEGNTYAALYTANR